MSVCVPAAGAGTSSSIICEECSQVPSVLLCLPCSAYLCKQCLKDTHGTKVLKAHPNVNVPKLPHRIDVSGAGEELLSSQEAFFGELKLDGEVSQVISQLEETIRQQKIAINVWDYSLEKIRDRLEAAMGPVIQTVKQNSSKVVSDAVALKMKTTSFA